MLAVRITLTGRVQGVGFRWWASDVARQLRLRGHASNLPDGRVELLAQGEPEAVYRLIKLAVEDPTTSGRPGRVADFELNWIDVDPDRMGFSAH